ncbi:MAG: hypothetical protein PHR56_09245 [Dehalococcoidales bacterium]|nr:hypothetical protein [Dehalococcoidales bacterium]
MSTGKKIGIGIGSFFGLIIIAALIIFILLTRPPAGPPSPPPLPTGTGVATGATPTPVPVLQQQVDDILKKIEESKQTGQAQEVKLVITEADATAKLRSSLPVTASGITIKDGSMFFRPGLTIIQIGAEYQGLTIYPNIQVLVIAKDGKVGIEVASLDVGAIPLPMAKDQLAGIVNDQFQNALAATKDINVTKVEVGVQQITVTGMTKPK